MSKYSKDIRGFNIGNKPSVTRLTRPVLTKYKGLVPIVFYYKSTRLKNPGIYSIVDGVKEHIGPCETLGECLEKTQNYLENTYLCSEVKKSLQNQLYYKSKLELGKAADYKYKLEVKKAASEEKHPKIKKIRQNKIRVFNEYDDGYIDLWSEGAAASEAHVRRQTLANWVKVGVLPQCFVDPSNGRRYYTDEYIAVLYKLNNKYRNYVSKNRHIGSRELARKYFRKMWDDPYIQVQHDAMNEVGNDSSVAFTEVLDAALKHPSSFIERQEQINNGNIEN